MVYAVILKKSFKLIFTDFKQGHTHDLHLKFLVPKFLLHGDNGGGGRG